MRYKKTIILCISLLFLFLIFQTFNVNAVLTDCSGMGDYCNVRVTCSDNGNYLGGGSCSEMDTQCGDGMPDWCWNFPYNPDDTCGGTADSPSVTWYYCSGSPNRYCTLNTTTMTDSCSKPGSSCSAADWTCTGTPGTLSNTTTSGTDAQYSTCQSTVYSCSNNDGGSTTDTCSSSLSYVGAGSDTYNDCTASGCTNTGNCDGAGTCQTPTAGTDPNSACPNSQCYTGNCDGGGSCSIQSGTDTYSYCANSGCYTGNCDGGGATSCGYASAGTDPWNYCTASYTSCPTICTKSGTGANCAGGSNACETSTVNVATNYYCSGGSEVFGNCGDSGWNACAGTGGVNGKCRLQRDNYGCLSGSCSNVVSLSVQDVAYNNVCIGSGTEVAGSATYYSYIDPSYTSCSAPSSPSSGFGLQQKNKYACDGSNGAQGPIVNVATNSCGTGCCNPNSPGTCVTSGSSSNMYTFPSSGDSTSTDYCASAVAYDCNTNSDCLTGYQCINKMCMGPNLTAYKNNSGTVNAYMDNFGNLQYRGTLTTSGGASTCSAAPVGSIIFRTLAGSPICIFSNTGNVNVAGTLNQNQGTLTPGAGNVTFANTSAIIGYINPSGNIYLRGGADQMH